MPFELSKEDLFRLEQARFKHFRELFQLPHDCCQQIDLDCSLMIVAATQDQADRILGALDRVRYLAWICYGAPDLSIWFNNAQVWEGISLRDPEEAADLQSEATRFEEDPMPATIDRKAIAEATRTELGEAINSQIDTVIQEEVQEILNGTDLQQRVRDRLSLFLGQASNAGTNGSGNGTGTAVMEAPAKRSTKAPAKTQTKAPAKTAAKTATPPKAAAKTANPKAAEATVKAFKLPRNLKAVVSNRYQQTLEKCMIGNDRAALLDAVVSETPEGKEWLNTISVAIHKKFKKSNAPTIYKGLLDNAKKLKG